MSTLTRRNAIITAAAGICAGACGCQMTQETHSGPMTVDVGTMADYPAPGVNDSFAKSAKVLVVRITDRIYVTTAVCTHRGCTVAWKDGAIRCPCHGSVFGTDGVRAAGPARTPLVRYAISLNNQRLVVDKTREFVNGQWDDPAAFVHV